MKLPKVLFPVGVAALAAVAGGLYHQSQVRQESVTVSVEERDFDSVCITLAAVMKQYPQAKVLTLKWEEGSKVKTWQYDRQNGSITRVYDRKPQYVWYITDTFPYFHRLQLQSCGYPDILTFPRKESDVYQAAAEQEKALKKKSGAR